MPMRPPRLLAATLAVLAGAAAAASMSPEKLRLCVGLELDREAIDRIRSEQRRGLDAAERRLEASSRRLEERRAGLDRSDAEAVDRFNQAVAEHNRLHDDVDARLAALDASVPRQNELVRRYNSQCLAETVSERAWQTEKHRQQQARRAAGRDH